MVQLGRWRPRSSRAGAVALARYTGPRSETCWIQLGGIPLEQVPRGTRHRSISRRRNLGSGDCGARYVELPSSIRVRIMQRADYAVWPARIARVSRSIPTLYPAGQRVLRSPRCKTLGGDYLARQVGFGESENYVYYELDGSSIIRSGPRLSWRTRSKSSLLASACLVCASSSVRG